MFLAKHEVAGILGCWCVGCMAWGKFLQLGMNWECVLSKNRGSSCVVSSHAWGNGPVRCMETSGNIELTSLSSGRAIILVELFTCPVLLSGHIISIQRRLPSVFGPPPSPLLQLPYIVH